MRKKILSIIVLCSFLCFGFNFSASAATYEEITTLSHSNTARLSQSAFAYGDEWLFMALARGGQLSTEQAADYVQDLTAYLRAHQGVLHDKKYTEYSRVILALSSIGLDASDIGGYNLLLPLADYEQVIWQGINGPIFALLALDSRSYELPFNAQATTQADRELYLNCILNAQRSDGSWNLTASSAAGDVDLTAMALQALAKYQDRAAVSQAIERALDYLAQVQEEDGSFAANGIANAESTAQVLLAYGELGIDVNDPRFCPNRHSAADALLKFSLPQGGFRHAGGDKTADALASEQGLCALVSLTRAKTGQNSFYRMQDAIDLTAAASAAASKNADIRISPKGTQAVTFSDIAHSPYQEAISELASRGMVSGRSAETFAPAERITRAEFAAILVKTLGLSKEKAVPFGDVADDAWYYPAIRCAYNYQLVSGTSAVTFEPAGYLSRQEAAAMVSRAATLCGLNFSYDERACRDVLCVFRDYPACADWAMESLAFCYDRGILDDSVSLIKPTEAISRGEVAQMLYNMLALAQLL